MRRRTEGFLFDVHEGKDAVVLWIYKNDGALLRLEVDFHPRIYARAERSLLRTLGSALINRGLIGSFRLTEGIEFWSGKAIEVGEYALHRYENKRRVVDWLAAHLSESALYNADLDIPQYYLYWSDLFPLCQVEVEYERDHLDQIHCLSSPWETDYRLPDLRILEMKLSRSRFLPLGKGNSLVLSFDGRSYELEPRTWRELLEMVNGALQRVDPDVILSEHGDENIFPALIQAAKREKTPLGLDRDFIPTERAVLLDGKSYFSYGRILYKPPSYICFGRWHVDAATSFIVSETGLEGLIELSRLSRLPPQKVARTNPGTAMNSIECYQAFKNRILIPYQKAEPEKYKTAWELLLSDKGGLTYMQPIGAFENVAEIDYASMYPTLMMKKNLSPETVRCSCCSNVRVPEIKYNVCEKREGLLPRALKPILQLRRAYKALKKKSHGKERDIYDRRQHALKWLLVTCFGYTGYRN
ncbi:MAG: DNA polymerase domain-containing protein, partial [candidate division WOR-3 bacterium]